MSDKVFAATTDEAMLAGGGAVIAGTDEPPAMPGMVTVPKTPDAPGTAIRVTVAIAPCTDAGATRSASSKASMPLPFAVNAPFSKLGLATPATEEAALVIMLVMAVTAAFRLAVFAALFSALMHPACGVGGAHRLTNAAPPGCPAAVETIKSVSGVMLTVCPAAVATEVKFTTLPPAVPVTVNTNGGTPLATLTV